MDNKKEEKLQKRLDNALYKFRKSELQEFSNYLSSPLRIILMNFLAGTARGLGFLVGAAIILTVVIFVITQILSQIPIVGAFFQWLGHFIQQNMNQVIPPSAGQ